MGPKAYKSGRRTGLKALGCTARDRDNGTSSARVAIAACSRSATMLLAGLQSDRCKATVSHVVSENEKVERFMRTTEESAAVDHKKRCVGTMQLWSAPGAR